jgi:hypothetical protein
MEKKEPKTYYAFLLRILNSIMMSGILTLRFAALASPSLRASGSNVLVRNTQIRSNGVRVFW